MPGRFPPPGSTRPWNGRAVANARQWLATQTTWPTPCARCGQPVTQGHWHLGHRLDRQAHPHLTWDTTNWQIEHPHCSTRAGARQGNRRRGRRATQQTKAAPTTTPTNSSPPRAAQAVSFTGTGATPAPAALVPPRVSPGSGGDPTDYSRDVWQRPWLAPLLADMPPSASLPRWQTDPHPRAVGSLGPVFEAWYLAEHGVTLRWWQRWAATRQLEVDAEGRLVWREVWESTPRRAGKSVRLRGMAMFRLGLAPQLGETQLILFTGKDLPICKEILGRMWPWALHPDRREAGWGVRKTNGQEEVTHPDGSRWMVRGQDSVYGYDTCMGMVDEAWAVKAQVVDEGMEPSMLDRVQPQLHLTSTAHRRATALMRRRRSAAMRELLAPVSSLLLHWGADPGADIDDRRVWRAAAPHWTDAVAADRERVWAKVSSGQADPDPDEPDPVEAWRAQYLNIWPFAEPAERVELAMPGWAGLRRAPVAQPPRGGIVAIDEARDGAVVGVLRLVGDFVYYREVPTLREAVGLAVYADQVVVGLSLFDAAGREGLRHAAAKFGSRHTAAATPYLGQVVRSGRLWHDHDPGMLAQAEGAVVAETEAGRSLSAMRSGPAGVLGPKLLAWALHLERSVPVARPVVW